jgi:hypothetical protein
MARIKTGVQRLLFLRQVFFSFQKSPGCPPQIATKGPWCIENTKRSVFSPKGASIWELGCDLWVSGGHSSVFCKTRAFFVLAPSSSKVPHRLKIPEMPTTLRLVSCTVHTSRPTPGHTFRVVLQRSEVQTGPKSVNASTHTPVHHVFKAVLPCQT